MTTVRLALVIGGEDSGYEEIDVVNLTRLQPLTSTIFLLETEPSEMLKYIKKGAGNELFSPEEIKKLLSTFISK